MATDFNTNAIASGGGFKPSPKDTPTRIGERIETLEDIISIPNPWVGMIVYVKDTGKRYEVLSIHDVQSGLSKVSRVNEYRELPYVDKDYVDNAIANAQLGGEDTELPNLDEYAGKSYVNEQIIEIQNVWLGGKQLKYVTQTEYDALTEEEKNDDNIVWNIKDAEELTIDFEPYAKKEDVNKALNLKADKTEIPNIEGLATETFVTNAIANAQLGGENATVDLSGYATKDDLNLKADKIDLHQHDNKSILDTITQQQVDNWNNQFSGDYNDLTNKPNIPTKTSQLTNDNNFLSEIPENYVTEEILSNKDYVTKSYMDEVLKNMDSSSGSTVLSYDETNEELIISNSNGSSSGVIYDATNESLTIM